MRIDVDHEGESSIDLTENDLVFITNGGCVENSAIGSRTHAAWKFRPERGGGWDMWKRIAAQDPFRPSGEVLLRSGATTG